MYSLPKGVLTPSEFGKAMHNAIGLELATIPCYLSTYYSINRTPDQQKLYNSIRAKVDDDKKAQDLVMDIVLYANKAGGAIMSVVIEEMLHLSLSSNVHQAVIGPPQLMDLGKALTYPAYLFGDPKEFKINRGPLSIDQLVILLKIESPNVFEDDPTIGQFYDKIIQYVNKKLKPKDFKARKGQPQLVPSQPYYSQNSINTVYYDKKHKPKFPSEEGSGPHKNGIIEVVDIASANAALEEIIEQGEGNPKKDEKEFVIKNGYPEPAKVSPNGTVKLGPEYKDDAGELSHFGKFMELYSLAWHYKKKFEVLELDDFFSYFVSKQDVNPVSSDYYPDTSSIYCQSQLANAIYTYILLMIETCYHQQLPTQFEVFMMGIHKSMIWLLSELGNGMRRQDSYNKEGELFTPAVTFEFYAFKNTDGVSPKDQLIQLARNLIDASTVNGSSPFEWLLADRQYLHSLPNVALNYSVKNGPML